MTTTIVKGQFFETAKTTDYNNSASLGTAFFWMFPIDVTDVFTTNKVQVNTTSVPNPATKIKIALYDKNFVLIFGDETQHTLTLGLNSFTIPNTLLSVDTYYVAIHLNISASFSFNNSMPTGSTEVEARYKIYNFNSNWPSGVGGSVGKGTPSYSYAALFVLATPDKLQRTYKIEEAIAKLQSLFRLYLPGVNSAPDYVPDTPPPDPVSVITRPLSVTAIPESQDLMRIVHTIEIIVEVYRGHQVDAFDKLIDYAEFVPLLLAQNQSICRTVDKITNLRSNGIVPASYAGKDMLGYVFNLDLHMAQGGNAIGTIPFEPLPDFCLGIRGAIEAFQSICREQFTNVSMTPDLAVDQIDLYPAIICYPGQISGTFQSSNFSIQLQTIIVEVHIGDVSSGMALASEIAYPFGDLIPLIARDFPTLNNSISGFSGNIEGTGIQRLGWGLSDGGKESIGYKFNFPVKLLQGRVL